MERHELEQSLARELGRDERLLWSGQPKQGILFRASDLFLIPFSLLWCGFAIFWEVGVVVGDTPFFFKLWGIPFVLIGLYMVAGRFVADSMERKRTVYGLTNQRVILVGGLTARRVTSLALRTLPEVTFVEHSDGTGTITLGSSAGDAWGGTNWSGNRRTTAPALERIDDARAVYEQLREAQKTG